MHPNRPNLERSALFVVLALLAAPPSSGAESVKRFRFESNLESWRPRAASVKVSRVQGGPTGPGGRHCLRVAGRMDGGWNYACSGRYSLEPGRLYRLSAWVRVRETGDGTPAPYLKCEFVGREGRSPAGQVHTGPYELARRGTWQRLQVEFQAPGNAAAFWLALEKGTSAPSEIDALLDEIVIEPIARLSVIEQYRLAPFPEELEKRRGVHPRLYLDARRLEELREAIKTTHAPLWRELRTLADRAVQRGPPAYRRDDGSSGAEQLWQRGVGNTMPVLAMAYVLSGERRYLESARAWALASCGYETWGLGRIDGMDLAAGHQLFGLGIVYDWCHDELGEAARRTIRATIQRRGSAMFEAAATGKVWWRRSYLQNHLWVNVCGLAAAGLAVFDEVDDASLWVGLALEKFRRTMDALGPDGASHEGVGYWEYGVEYMLKFMALARQNIGVDLYDYPWWRETARYALYLSLPRDAWTRGNCIVDIADCPRGHWYGPDYLLRGLAREYRDPRAQWLAAEMDEANVTSPGAPWLNLVWFDPGLRARAPADLPTLHHFEDMGIVSARTDWSGGESLVVFKCGPFIGHKALEAFSYDPGGGHVHPDANHFVLFGAGEWLLRDDGYRAKWTGQHNTLLVDGKGQVGEGKQWFDGSAALAAKARPRIRSAESGAALDTLEGEASDAYPEDLKLRSFRRILLFARPDVLIVADEIRVDEPRELELRFHPESRRFQRDGEAYVFEGKTAHLRLEPLTPASARIEAGDVAAEGRHGDKDQSLFTVRLKRRAKTWRNAVGLSWAPSDGPLRAVRLDGQGDSWRFRVGDRAISLRWETGKVSE